MLDFLNNDFQISEIQLACSVKLGGGASHHENRASHGLAIYLMGKHTFYFKNKRLKIEKNTIVYFPKGSSYTIKENILRNNTEENKSQPIICYAINFQMPENVTFEPFAFKVKNINTYLENFKNSAAVWAKKKTGYKTKVKSELYNIIYNMQNENSLPYANFSVIQPAVDYIQTNYYNENIKIEEMAKLCNISTVHLRNTFIKAFGLSPVKYINTLKITRAKELLLSSLHTVSEACYLSGYNDESYFSREFKKHTGVSPKEYKKASLKK